FRLFNPNPLLSRLLPYSDWIFSVPFLLIWLIFGVWTATIAYLKWDQLGAASSGILSGYSWIWLMLTWVLLKVVHEFAHGIACKRYGGEVPEAGILLLLFTPMAYVNVTSMWRFSNPRHRMIVSVAGMYVELFLSFLALVVWNYTDGVTASIAFNVFIMASVTTLLFNANPLMRFDGYFLLSDGIGVVNLYGKGTKWFGDVCKKIIFGVPVDPVADSREFWKLAVYGSLAFFWKILISISLIIGAGVIFKGAGVVLSLAGVALFFGLPILKQFQILFGSNAKYKIDPRRMMTSCVSIGMAFCIAFFLLKAPATKSAPAIVQFSEETSLRAGADGFISEILVADGDPVTQGQTLIVLSNPELSNEVVELERLVKESRIKERILRDQGELAAALAEENKNEELMEQAKEKREQASGLTVVAPFDGFVFRRRLNNQLGNFAKRGDPLITIAQQSTKEVVVSVDQSDFESLKGSEGSEFRICISGMPVFHSKLQHVNPTATQHISFPSLCAHVGGALDVQQISNPDDDSQYELLNPRFDVVLCVDNSVGENLESGQRGRAIFSARKQSLGSYLYLAACDWFQKKIEQAIQTAPF
ncbi:MAG: efflux RND transporter periplasmic adaptor subunit, partial [Planctomycetota bacterium]